MKTTLVQKLLLGAAGMTAFAVGALILVAPHGFYRGYGIELGRDPSLLSELRAPGAGLAAAGLLMFLGCIRTGWAQLSAVLAVMVFTAFPAGRLVGLAVDGLPSDSVLGALALELAIGGLCCLGLRPLLVPRAGALVPPAQPG
ncbi:MAG: DUF4345 domain-containing protein [Pseudomonadota bacterium]